jgi:hypothetical protein
LRILGSASGGQQEEENRMTIVPRMMRKENFKKASTA